MRNLITCLLFAGLCSSLSGQTSTASYVYSIFQQRCASCHNTASPSGGLDLVGSGASDQARMLNVFQNVFNANPTNSHAASEGYKRVYPGNAWRSSIFRQINNGLQPNMILDAAEGDPHSSAQHMITNAEKEAIRQWILFGAPSTGVVTDTSLIRRYYDGEAAPSFQTPPAPPAASEGFQVHVGPFFLAENEEEEYFWKYPTELSDDVEVDKLEVLFGPYSHHFIMFEYLNPAFANQKRNGFRLDNAHSSTQLVTVQQYADTLDLPEGSAFFWDKGNVLDMNTHYVNYSQTKVASCEAYVNIYTKPKGTAAQEMKVALLANTNIYIPNDGNTHTFEAYTLNRNTETFLWALTSHTHQWGTDFNVYTRNVIGSRDDLIFDSEYEDGDPTKFFFGYDYRHPPIRYYSDFLSLKPNEGLIYEASYVNNGSVPARWGDTSDDEMMVLAFFYLDDTAGVSTGTVTSNEAIIPDDHIRFGPNPMINNGRLEVLGKKEATLQFELMDAQGRKVITEVQRSASSTGITFEVSRKGLSPGMYFFRLYDNNGQNRYTGKWLIQD